MLFKLKSVNRDVPVDTIIYFFAILQTSAKALGSVTAKSASIFLLIVTLAFFKPFIKVLYVKPLIVNSNISFL